MDATTIWEPWDSGETEFPKTVSNPMHFLGVIQLVKVCHCVGIEGAHRSIPILDFAR